MSSEISISSDLTQVAIASDPAEARHVQEAIERQLRLHRYTDLEVFSVRLAVEEAIVNAIKHGNQLDRKKKVHISYCIRAEQFYVQITDEGGGFDPTDVPDPRLIENVERPCGRGLMLMRHYMCDVQYNAQGNSVRMIKNRSNGQLKKQC
jgi:serine/threonine-protein kinase RsbW